MHELPLILNITLALVFAFFGGVLARRIGLPTIVGYLLAGILIGPFTPGFIADHDTLHQLAEMGVIFLMFGVGLHFSFKDLWNVRDIAIPGALIQTLFASLLGFGLTQLWGWTPVAGIVMGLSISVASTVVLLRGLIDNNLLNTPHGQAAVGWLVMEDILSVLILILMPVLGSDGGEFSWAALGLTLLKAAAFVLIMGFAGVRLLPWLLERIAHTRSRELFILAVIAITLGTAMAASGLFGVSLALGAFVAGAIISQSHYSHQVSADVFGFREIFSILFFVSVGMLVNPVFLWENLTQVVLLTLLVIAGKAIIVLLIGLFFPRPARTFLVIAIGLAQVGEFSFILGQAGLSNGMLTNEQYSLILAAALISITLNPFLYKLLPGLELFLRKIPLFWKRLEANKPHPLPEEADLKDHIVIVGYGGVGKHLVDVIHSLARPMVVIEADAERLEELSNLNIPALYGDAGNSEIMLHANLKDAVLMVTTVPDETSALLIVTAAHDINPKLPIIARAASEESIRNLAEAGANYIIHPELEGGLEIVHHTLLTLGYPLREAHEFIEAIRTDQYDYAITSDEEHRSLHDLLQVMQGIEIAWLDVHESSPLVGQTLAEANIRSQTGASVVALLRNRELIANPKSLTRFEVGDRIGVIGEKEQVDAVQSWVGVHEA